MTFNDTHASYIAPLGGETRKCIQGFVQGGVLPSKTFPQAKHLADPDISLAPTTQNSCFFCKKDVYFPKIYCQLSA